MACLWVVVLLSVGSASGTAVVKTAANLHLGRAEKLLYQLKYKEAAEALDAALSVEGNDRATLLRIYELSGVVAGTLSQPDRAVSFFKMLLVLNPEHQQTRTYSPKLRPHYFEAKAWVADHGAIRFEANRPNSRLQPAARARVALRSDPLEMARRVRFHVRLPGEPWQTRVVGLADGGADSALTAESLEWWAELLGEKSAILSQVGTVDSPLVESTPGPAEVAQGSSPAEARPAPLSPLPVAERSSPHPEMKARLRPWAYSALAAAAVSGIAGGAFGLSSRGRRNEIAGASRDEAGRIVGLNQVDAAVLAQSARTHAIVANSLFAAAGTLAITSAALLLLGVESPQEAAP